jgi:hypothetical protein
VIDIGIAKDLGLDLSKPDSLTDHVVHDDAGSLCSR